MCVCVCAYTVKNYLVLCQAAVCRHTANVQLYSRTLEFHWCLPSGDLTYFTFLRPIKREKNNRLLSDTDIITAQFKSHINAGSQQVRCAELILNSGMRFRHSSDLFVHLFSAL